MVLERKRQNYAVELMSGNEKRSSSPGKPHGGINKLNRLRYLDLSGSSISSLSLKSVRIRTNETQEEIRKI